MWELPAERQGSASFIRGEPGNQFLKGLQAHDGTPAVLGVRSVPLSVVVVIDACFAVEGRETPLAPYHGRVLQATFLPRGVEADDGLVHPAVGLGGLVGGLQVADDSGNPVDGLDDG